MRLLTLVLAVLVAAWSSTALATCGGTNMLDELAATDPAARAAILARAAAVPNGEGRFWRIERAGTAPSYVFGTFHTGDAVGTVPDAAWAALDAARLAVFEITLDEQAAIRERIAADPSLVYDTSAPPLSSRLDPDAIVALRTALTMRGLPGKLSERMRPWMLFATLSLPVCEMKARLGGARALDEVMARRAAEDDIPARGLETFDDVLAAFDRIGPEALLALLAADREMLAHDEDAFRTSLDLYAAGHTAAIATFSEWQAGQAGDEAEAAAADALDELVGGRNAAWLPALEDALAGGNAFVAVGALHLPGGDGLIARLRADGWTVTRLD